MRGKQDRTNATFFSSHIHWMEQFPDDSPRLRLPIVIILGVLSLDATVGAGAAVSGTVTHDAPGSSSATTAAPASTNDEDVVVAADGSTRPARLAEDVLLLVFPVAATTACRLRRLFDCGDCDAWDCGKLAQDEPMLDIDWKRSRMRCVLACCCGSRWRVRVIDNFRRMMFPSGITLVVTFDGGGASETDELEFVGSGVNETRERLLNGDRTLYATGG
jgi:hypothetical protein